MRKIEKEYIDLINQSLRAKDEIIDDLLRINENIVRETKELIYEFRQYLKSNKVEKVIEKEGK